MTEHELYFKIRKSLEKDLKGFSRSCSDIKSDIFSLEYKKGSNVVSAYGSTLEGMVNVTGDAATCSEVYLALKNNIACIPELTENGAIINIYSRDFVLETITGEREPFTCPTSHKNP